MSTNLQLVRARAKACEAEIRVTAGLSPRLSLAERALRIFHYLAQGGLDKLNINGLAKYREDDYEIDSDEWLLQRAAAVALEWWELRHSVKWRDENPQYAQRLPAPLPASATRFADLDELFTELDRDYGTGYAKAHNRFYQWRDSE
jgi:hypothetical protein